MNTKNLVFFQAFPALPLSATRNHRAWDMVAAVRFRVNAFVHGGAGKEQHNETTLQLLREQTWTGETPPPLGLLANLHTPRIKKFICLFFAFKLTVSHLLPSRVPATHPMSTQKASNKTPPSAGDRPYTPNGG